MAELKQRRLGRRTLVGAGLVVAVTAAWIFWSHRHQPEPAGAPKRPDAFVKIAGPGSGQGSGRVLEERAELFDPAPLFIPTARNYGQGALPASVVKQPGQVFDDFGAKLQTAESGLPAYGAQAASVPDSLVEIVVRANEVPFAGIGQLGGQRSELVERLGTIDVKSLDSGELSARVPLTIRTPAGADFAPVEFVILVAEAGFVGEPLLTAGSGQEEVDVILREFLNGHGQLSARLSPGRYAVTVGP